MFDTTTTYTTPRWPYGLDRPAAMRVFVPEVAESTESRERGAGIQDPAAPRPPRDGT